MRKKPHFIIQNQDAMTLNLAEIATAAPCRSPRKTKTLTPECKQLRSQKPHFKRPMMATQIRLDIWNVNTTKDNGKLKLDWACSWFWINLSSKLNWTNHHTASLRYVSNAIQVTFSRPKSKEIQTAVRCHAAEQFILNQGDKWQIFQILP